MDINQIYGSDHFVIQIYNHSVRYLKLIKCYGNCALIKKKSKDGL